MDFRTATDRLKDRVTDQDLADACGVAHNTIRRARMDPESPNYRSPPANWREVVARLAEDHARRLFELAKELRK